MSTNQEYKKAQRKTEESLEPRKNRHGKQPHQRMKPYLILEYLMRETDEDEGQEHVRSAYDIAEFLEDSFGITSDRRSIYSDIDEINRILYMLDSLYDEEYPHIDEVDEEFDEAEKNGYLSDLQTIVYDKNRKGFYVKQRNYDLNDIRLLAECVYSARFIDEKRAKKLAKVALKHVSERQARRIRHDALLVDRTKTTNTQVYYSVETINNAMRRDAHHNAHKISFKYLTYNINDVSKQAERRGGAKYIVSPFKLLINDSNYYMLAFDDRSQEIRTYRVDRMKEVTELTDQPRDGEHEFLLIDMDSFTRRTFGMFSGESKRITLRFDSPLLDTVVDRFGTKEVRYRKADDSHFYIETEVDISGQFFGWLLGLGDMVKIMGPDSVITEFTEYIDRVRNMY